MKKVVSRVFKGITLALMGILVVIALSAKASGGEPTLFNHQIKVVVSGSMEPEIQTGSIILNKLPVSDTTYEKGDIITFHSEDKLVTHRIVDVKEVNGADVYQTKGDNNNAPDTSYVSKEEIEGKYAGFTIPKLGYLTRYATSKIGFSLLLFIPGLLMVLAAGKDIFKATKEMERKAAA